MQILVGLVADFQTNQLVPASPGRVAARLEQIDHGFVTVGRNTNLFTGSQKRIDHT